MKVRLKDKSVNLDKVDPIMFYAIHETALVYEQRGYTLTLTSVNDGVHSPNSLHPKGRAFDARTRNVPVAERPALRADVQEVLGEDFDVVLEKDHLHVEYQPEGETK